MAKLVISTHGNIQPNLFIGPALDILLSARYELECAGESEEDDIEYVKSTDIGLVFGGGLDIGGEQRKLTVEVRYTLGLTSIYKPPKYANRTLDVKNGVFSFLVGLAF